MAVKRYKGAKAKADKLFSEIIRSLGYCEAEGWPTPELARSCSAQLQTAHIVTRKRSATRTDLRNAFCLCFSHHRYFTDFPREFSHFISDTWAAGYYDQIYWKSNIPTKVDWQERVDFLSEVQRAINAGKLTLEGAREIENEAS